MKWIKSEVAPKVCALLVDEQEKCIGMVEYDKYAQVESRWKAVVMPNCNTVGRAQTKREAQRMVEAHYQVCPRCKSPTTIIVDYVCLKCWDEVVGPGNDRETPPIMVCVACYGEGCVLCKDHPLTPEPVSRSRFTSRR